MAFELLHLHRDRCPLCGAAMEEMAVNCRIFFGEMWCPGCRHRLWYLNTSDGCLFFNAFTCTPICEQAIDVLAQILGVSADELLLASASPDQLWIDRVSELRVDSLDAVELTIEFENELENRLHSTGVL